MNSATKILDIAETQMRSSGYNAVSYRDIAAEMGIKSASIHYHFPKKEDLGETLVRRYAENLSQSLHNKIKDETEPGVKLLAYIDLYRRALTEQNLICLCAVLGAEASGLPDKVAVEIQRFFDTNINWLEEIYQQLKGPSPRAQAKAALAALEGAMVVANVNDDMDVFEAVADRIVPDWVRISRLPNQD